MEFSRKDMKILKGVAILFMLSLHLFARKDVGGLYETFSEINGIPLVYYIGLFGDACVPIYLFASGYGLYLSLGKLNTMKSKLKKNLIRILKLLINFWIILFLFMAIAFLVGMPEAFSGGINQFFLNFFLLSSSYNGAWWYLQTYVILVLLSPVFIKIIQKHHFILVLAVSGIIYSITYLQRIKHVIDFGDNTALNIVVNAIVLVGTSQLAFVVGVIFAKEKIYSIIYNWFYNIPFKNALCLMGILMLVIIHGFIETMFIAPFTAIAFICIFNLMNKNELVEELLLFVGDHSTNLWLTHMFFYMTIFPTLVFAVRYPILIFLWLVILCLFTSFGINSLYHPIVKLIDSKLGGNSKKYQINRDNKSIS
ncbi:acyltransferase [Oceanobacillus zhaokaii]|uniref:Acyltransferase n=1 Tax=Oceanobacillus zhaokaii TaxID=2052660 RepID=A0A345PL88_9BACI|nr:acyltransferase [Oceanobacillus zhaokaii]AXI10768.1 acyltransferase [Oceanobacillus zhaokaii]